MHEFFIAVLNHPFLQAALLTGLLASVACGIVGTYVTVRRISYIAGAISHSTLGGMGVARYLERVVGITWITPLYGAIAAALLAALIIGLVSLYAKEREDSVLSMVWSLGMAIGILFIAKTPGNSEDLMSYLFGNILLVSPDDLWLIAGLDAVVVGCSVLCYNQLLAISFDEEYARLRGLRVAVYYLLLLGLTALTIVLLVQVVGVVLVIALLTLPAATAAALTKRLWQTMLVATLLTLACTTGGLALSYGPDLPAGATIIVLAGIVYLLVVLVPRRWRRRA